MKEYLGVNGLQIESIDVENSGEIIALAQLYADVFAGPPWNEVTRCPKEGSFFGAETTIGDACPNCATALTQAYPQDETIEYIQKELRRPDAAGFLLKDGDKLVGFTWGFSYESPEAFVQEKYRTQTMQQAVVDVLKQHGIDGKFYYFSESGLDSAFRGRGLSNFFFERRLTIANAKGLHVVQRTNATSPMMAVNNRFGFTQVMGPEVQIDRVVKTIQITGSYVNGMVDTELEQRVLFVR